MKRTLVIDSDTEDEAYRDIAAEAATEMEDEAYRGVAAAAAAEEESDMKDGEDEATATVKEGNEAAAESDEAAENGDQKPSPTKEDEEDEKPTPLQETIIALKPAIEAELKDKITEAKNTDQQPKRKRGRRSNPTASEIVQIAESELLSNIDPIQKMIDQVDEIKKPEEFEKKEKELWEAISKWFAKMWIIDEQKINGQPGEMSEGAKKITRKFEFKQIIPAMERLRNLINTHRLHPDYTAEQCRQVSGDEIVEEMLKNPIKMGYSDEPAMLKQTTTPVPEMWTTRGMNEQIIEEISEAINKQLQSNPLPSLERGFYSWGNEIPKEVWQSDDAKRITLIVPMQVAKFCGLATKRMSDKDEEGHTLAIVINQEKSGPGEPCTISIADPSVLVNSGIEAAEEEGYRNIRDPIIKFVPKHSNPSPTDLNKAKREKAIPVSEYVLERALNQGDEKALRPKVRKTNLENLKNYLARHNVERYDVKAPPTYNTTDDCSPFALAIGWYLSTKDELLSDQEAFKNEWSQDKQRLPYYKRPPNSDDVGQTLLRDIRPVLKLFNGLRNQMLQHSDKRIPPLITTSDVKPTQSDPLASRRTRTTRKPARYD